MQKLLLFILLLAAIYYWRRVLTRDNHSEGTNESGPPPKVKAVEDMHACARCALLVPRSEGVEAAGDFFCSAEHARLGRGTPPV